MGTQLRLLLSQLDGELTALYKRQGHQFRPRFYPVFQLLLRNEGASVSEIADHLQCSQPAATQTLVEMKRCDFIKYAKGRDRRERIVSLSQHGLFTAKELQPIWNAVGRAASQLNDELPLPLSTILDEALAALARKSFPERIAEFSSTEED
ncbi:MAG: MarR family transcriptional regulator [Pseudomonadota bacterium]